MSYNNLARGGGGSGDESDTADRDEDADSGLGGSVPGAPDDGGESDPSTGGGVDDGSDTSRSSSDDDSGSGSSGSGFGGSVPGAPDDGGASDPPTGGGSTGSGDSSGSDGSSGSGFGGSVPGAPDDGGASDPSTPDAGAGESGSDPSSGNDTTSSDPSDAGGTRDPGSGGSVPGAPDDGGATDPSTPDPTGGTSDPPRTTPGGGSVPGAPNDGGPSDPSTSAGTDGTPGDGTTTTPPSRQNEFPDQRVRQRASDETIRQNLREQAANDRDFASDEIVVTGFEEISGGDLRPVIQREGSGASPVDDVPAEFRSQLRESTAENLDGASADDVVLTSGDDGLTVALTDSAQRRRIADQLDEQFEGVEITADDVIRNAEGEFTVDETTTEQIENSRRQFIDELGGDPADVERAAETTGAEQRRQAAEQLDEQLEGVDITADDVVRNADGEFTVDERTTEEIENTRRQFIDEVGGDPTGVPQQRGRLEPEGEPGAAATAVGSTFEFIDSSPFGAAVRQASEPIFGDPTVRGDGVVGEIDDFLEDIERGFESRVTNPAREIDPDRLDPQSVGLARPFGITGEQYQDFAVEFSEFANPGAIGRDFVTLAESGVQAREFLANRGPEGAQLAGELLREGASQAPGAARGLAEDVAENPGDAATTAAALTATFGAGAAASGVARGGASLAARGAMTGARRADDVVGATGRADDVIDAARSRGGAIRDRAPDVEIRRDPSSGPLDVDPLLRQQIRNRVRGGGDPAVDAASEADESLARRIGAAVEEAQVNLRFNADAATSRLRETIPDRSSIPDPRPDTDGSLAREAGRRSRQAEINALLNAESAASRVRNAVPDRSSLPDSDAFALGDGSVARRAGRRFESERRSLRLSAAAAPSAVRQRGSDAVERVSEIVPSRPGELSFAESDASLARRAGRRYESERRSLALSAAAAPSAARNRASNAADEVLGRIESATGGRSDVLDRLERTDTDLGLSGFGLSERVPSVPRLDQRVRDAAAAASEATLRIGPVRPARADVGLDDLDVEFDTFDEDAVDFGFGDAASDAGRGSDTLDLDADVDTGSTGAGSGQLTSVRTTRRADSDVDVDGEVRARSRAGSGPDMDRVDPLAGVVGAGAAVFEGFDTGPQFSNFGGPTLDTAGTTESTTGMSDATDAGVDFSAPGLYLDAPAGSINISPPASSTATTTGIDIDTTTVTGSPPASTSPPSFRPPRVPSFDLPGGDRSDETIDTGLSIEDETFDTGVADADEVFENLF